MVDSRVVLASTSRYREELLARLGLPFDCESPDVDEAAVGRGELDPAGLAAELARRKAAAVAARRPDHIVIGSDQVCALDDEVLGKPGSPEGAVRQLLRLSGRPHRLCTAVAVAHPGGVIEFVDETTLTMRALEEDEVRRYVARDEPIDCAGSYKLEAGGIALFEAVQTRDYTAIVGLPLVALTTALRSLGLAIP